MCETQPKKLDEKTDALLHRSHEAARFAGVDGVPELLHKDRSKRTPKISRIVKKKTWSFRESFWHLSGIRTLESFEHFSIIVDVIFPTQFFFFSKRWLFRILKRRESWQIYQDSWFFAFVRNDPKASQAHANSAVTHVWYCCTLFLHRIRPVWGWKHASYTLHELTGKSPAVCADWTSRSVDILVS